MSKQEHREPISADVNGRTHRGTLIFRGTRKISVSVEYRGHERTDSRSWGTSPDELENARTMARLLLLQLVGDAKGTP
jgi:hypothetical protein